MKPLACPARFAGCATMPAPAGESYRALGTEPFWSIAIANGRLSYEAPDGPSFSVPAPRGAGARRRLGSVETRRITLDPRTPSAATG